MRVNLPVTSETVTVDPELTLVSVTDLQGRITYCNAAFVDLSGFASHELIGQEHNIVRHPDMPMEAFRDMWATIKARRPWTALVKNRRKDGGYYWVRANATPMCDGDQITGYLSVRRIPTDAEIAAADALYQTMRADEIAGRKTYRLHHGRVIPVGWRGYLHSLRHPGQLLQLGFIQGALALAVFGLITLGLPAALLAFGLAASAGLGLWATHAILVRPMVRLVDDANQLAAGDLTHKVSGGGTGMVGRLQQALNQMSVNLRAVVSDVRHEIDQFNLSVREIADGNEDLSSRTESQASSLQETAASMEQINSTVQSSAASAARGHAFAHTTSEITGTSNAAVASVAGTMKDIAGSSGQITEIIHLIEGVAFQTNILALNAAVEAARAGEQGRGFAVVAAEVRALAQRTATAAKEIKQLITQSTERISMGETQAQVALERMGDAMTAVDKVGTVLEEISTASNEQKLGIAQINGAISQMDSLTQQNAAMVEELAATARSLQAQAQAVSESMRLFRLRPGER